MSGLYEILHYHRKEIPKKAICGIQVEVTPSGGDLSIGYFYNKDQNPSKKEDAVEIHIHEYTKEGKFIPET